MGLLFKLGFVGGTEADLGCVGVVSSMLALIAWLTCDWFSEKLVGIECSK